MGLDVENRGAVKHIRIFYRKDIFFDCHDFQHGQTNWIGPVGRTDAENTHGLSTVGRGLLQKRRIKFPAFVKMKKHDYLLAGRNIF
jgi:hypothetical protein